MKGKKKQRGAGFYRKGIFLTLGFWGAVMLLNLSVCLLLSDYFCRLVVEGASELSNPQYWERFDQYYDPDASIDIKTRTAIFAYTSLFDTIDWDYETVDAFSSVDQDPEKEDSDFEILMEHLLFDGFHYYAASEIVDLNGNILKGTDTIVFEKTPCACEESGSVLGCKDAMIGTAIPDDIFTEEEFRRIAEVISGDPTAMVVSDRYLIGGARDSLFTPLSVTVYSGNGEELFSLDLSRNASGRSEEKIGTDRIYFHDVVMVFGRRTSYGEEQKTEMERWIGSVPTDRETIDKVKQRFAFESVHGMDFAFRPSKGGFGPFHLNRAVYYGENVRVYCYYRTTMVRPFIRVFLLLSVIPVGVFLPILLSLLIPYRRIRKEEKLSRSETDQAAFSEESKMIADRPE